MTSRAARLISVSLIVIYLLLTGVGLYFQFATGKIYLGDTIGLTTLSLSGLALVVWVAIGALILWHYPQNSIGWIMCIWPLFVALDYFTFGYYQVGELISLPGTRLALIWHNWAGGTIPAFFFTLIFLYFPTGRLLTPGWRAVVWITIFATSLQVVLLGIEPGPIYSEPYEPLPPNPIGVSESIWATLSPLEEIALLTTILCLVAGGISLVLRLHRARGEERQQIKWFAYFALFFPVSQILVPFWEEYGVQAWIVFIIALASLLLSVIGMAVAIAIAIFRYRLYAIDLIIRRTLVYGALTGTLLLIYFASITLLQGLMSTVSGQRSMVVTVISTLLIAALFNPLRHRIQSGIDRRFYRMKYDIDKALAAFSIQARDEVDLDKLSGGLLKIVDEALQPGYSSLWLLEVESKEVPDV